VIDLPGHRATLAGRPVDLTPTEFALLAVLAQNPGRTLTRGQLVDAVYDVAYDGYDRAIDSHIKNLRRKIEPDPTHPHYLLTVYGVGYKFSEAADEPTDNL
jgi:DNA-binding response OmpR family regulator